MDQPRYDCIVVGAGFAGLVASRQLAEAGYKVCLLESSDRIGGRAWTKVTGENSNIEVGSEWFDPELHNGLSTEVKRYGVHFIANSPLTSKFYSDGEEISDNHFNNPDFIELLNLIDKDVQRITFSNGFDQVDAYDLDIPFIKYLDKLQIQGWKRNFLLAQGFTLMGGDPGVYSALALLREIAGFGGTFNTFFKDLYRISNGSGSLALNIANDMLNSKNPIDIIYNSHIRSINHIISQSDNIQLQQQQHNNNNNDNNNNNNNNNNIIIVQLTDSKGQVYTANSVILAIPLNTICQLHCTPPLPEGILQASRSVNVGRCSKYWVEVQMESVSAHHTLSYNNNANISNKQQCIETYLYQNISHNNIIQSNSNLNTTTTNNNENNENDKNTFLLPLPPPQDQQHQLQQQELNTSMLAYFMLEDDDDDDNNSQRLLSRNTDTDSTLKTVHIPSSTIPSSTSTSASSSTSNTISKEQIGNLLEIHPNLIIKNNSIRHDFVHDSCFLGTWLAVRAGSAHIHAAACIELQKPLTNENRITFAGSDLSRNWSGWVDGAITSGIDAANRVLKI
eukprot:gene3613-7185_t